MQVPNLESSFYDILIADHCTHFDALSLKYVCEKAGFEIINCLPDFVAKELTLVVKPRKRMENEKQIEVMNVNSRHNLYTTIKERLEKMKEIVSNKQEGRFYIWGSSIAASWVASTFDQKCIGFIDEDKERVGNTHLGLNICSPKSISERDRVYLPFPKDVAEAIIKRYSKLKADFVII